MVGAASPVVEEPEVGAGTPARMPRRQDPRRPATRRCRHPRRGCAAAAATASGTGAGRPRARACPPSPGAWRSWPPRRGRSERPTPRPAPPGPAWPGRRPPPRRSRRAHLQVVEVEALGVHPSGADGHDGGRRAPPQQRRQRRGQHVRAEHLGGDGELHPVGRRLVGAGEGSGVVDQGVEAVVALRTGVSRTRPRHRGRPCRPGRRGPGPVRPPRPRHAPWRARSASRPTRCTVAPRRGQGRGRRQPDPRGGAGHHHDAAVHRGRCRPTPRAGAQRDARPG